MTEKREAYNKDLTLVVRKDVVDEVSVKITNFVKDGALHLPENYSPQNALKSAWLALQQAVDKNKRPVLNVCSRESIANALLKTIVQGLNPGKDQCYYIAYGKTLVCQRSYFGTMAVCKQLAGATDIYAQVVYQGDEFEYEIKGANKTIVKHIQKLENIDQSRIIAAYCVIERDGHDPAATIMTMEQIETAWKMSKMNPMKSDSTHQIHKEEMCKKTVVNRACKPLINSSSDSGLILDAYHESDDEASAAAFEEQVAAEANTGEIIDINNPVDDEEQDNKPKKHIDYDNEMDTTAPPPGPSF